MNRNLHRNIVVLVAGLLVLALALAGCSGGSGNSGSGDSDVLRVGMECAYAPFNWTQTDDANGAVSIDSLSWAGGYDVEIAKRVAESMGKELVIVKTDWDGLVPSLTSGKIDLIIAGMSATEERRQSIDFTDNYYTSDIVVVVKKDGPYADAKSIHDFGGAKITGQLQTLHYDFIDQMNGVDKQPAMDTFPTMIVALSSGKVDGYVSERPGAISATYSNPDLAYVVFEEGNGFDISVDEVSIAIGIAKDSPILDDVNAALAGISEEERTRLMEEAVINQPNA